MSQTSKVTLMRDSAYELEDAIDEIYEQLDRIKRELQKFPAIYERARSYWLAHIDGALLNREGWLGGSFISAASTLEDLQEGEEDSDG